MSMCAESVSCSAMRDVGEPMRRRRPRLSPHGHTMRGGTDPMPVAWFLVWTHFFLLSADDTARLWQELQRSRLPEARALKASWRRVQALRPHKRPEEGHKQLAGPMAPLVLAPLFEALYTEGQIDRALCSRVQEAILVHTTRDGTWDFLDEKGYRR